jgi:hypothetical protein
MNGIHRSLATLCVFAALLVSSPVSAACVDYAAEPKRLVELEPLATKGALDAATQDCLEQSYAASKEQVTKSKISRVLLVNAYATDTAQWARLVKRHLDEVDQSDPDIAYLYAFYLYNHGTPSSDVIHWSDVGLERRQVWTGPIHVARVNGLLRLRTLAALTEWKGLALKATSDPSVSGAAEDARVETKTFAREWLDFAREAGRDTTQPTEICLSAATAEACGIQGG